MENFNLEINFPLDYPEKPPLTKELDNKIPATFHRNPDGYLCLCAPVEQYLTFSKEPVLDNYIRNLLDPYLLSWLWFVKYNEMPWGERSHGFIGLIEPYQELLKLKNLQHTIRFMTVFIKNKIHHNQGCPCESGLSFKKCHKNTIQELENNLPKEQLVHDFIIILGGLI